MSSPFTKRLNPGAWEWPLAGASLVLGALLALAWLNEERRKGFDPDMQIRIATGKIDLTEFEKLSQEVAHLRAENTKLQNAVAGNSTKSDVLNEALQNSKLFAGLTDVNGPGITVTLVDSQRPDLIEDNRIIHDFDVLRIVNELWASGAEAIEVNGNRVVGSSSFRCVGPTILVDHQPIASPVHVRVIGDQEALTGALALPGGVVEELKTTDPNMVRIDKVREHRLKAFSGSTQKKFMKTTKVAG